VSGVARANGFTAWRMLGKFFKRNFRNICAKNIHRTKLCLTNSFMIYASGETPMIGDRIKDKQGNRATVIDIEGSRIMIRWDEGVVGMEYASDEFTLIARATK
jgi:hypothetical protein